MADQDASAAVGVAADGVPVVSVAVSGVANAGTQAVSSLGIGVTLTAAVEVLIEALAPSTSILSISQMAPVNGTIVPSQWPAFQVWVLASGGSSFDFVVDVEVSADPAFATFTTMRKVVDHTDGIVPTELKICCSSASPPTSGCRYDSRVRCCQGAWSDACTEAPGPLATGIYFWRARASSDGGGSFTAYSEVFAIMIDPNSGDVEAIGSITVVSGSVEPVPHFWFVRPSEGFVGDVVTLYGQSFEPSGACGAADIQVLFPPTDASNVEPARSAEVSYSCVAATGSGYGDSRLIDPVSGVVNVGYELVVDTVPATVAGTPGGPLLVRGV